MDFIYLGIVIVGLAIGGWVNYKERDSLKGSFWPRSKQHSK